MYKKILVALENSRSDRALLAHVADLAPLHGSELLLVHVADGWVARNYDQFHLQESEEMKKDREYLAELERELGGEGFDVCSILAMGDPATEIIRIAEGNPIDLIAMSTHGHGVIGDMLYGSTADKVRHKVEVPVLLLKVKD